MRIGCGIEAIRITHREEVEAMLIAEWIPGYQEQMRVAF